ncbi:NUDIX hydrolase [Flavihumibacter profundi]|uniref:NUDIX hydrolase n=1 Tax=Flavihumibacter profundi TaxID=2716883 RepID=UPI001CC3A0DA|nr:NUDIX domain-containing protein [Flavihumibacter profundi]MBZ5858247.1 NUDIX domain-containing protein [Flavihumibacter profundi]
MAFNQEIKQLFAKGHESYLRNISIDCIIFGFNAGELKILLLKAKFARGWALPGGLIGREEDIDSAAHRTLEERTGLVDIYMQQFKVFGQADRATQVVNKKLWEEAGIKNDKGWLFERFITVGYYALVDFNKATPSFDGFSTEAEWFNVYELPEMIMDHASLVADALEFLRLQLNYRPVGYSLLPEKFTMPELQKLYETILGRTLDRRNFQRKILGVGILKRLKDRKVGVTPKAPYYYRFDMKKYQQALSNGMGFQL